MTETNTLNETLNSAQPAEVDSCGYCVVPENIETPVKAVCPESGTPSNKVPLETLENLIIQDKKQLISKDVQYYHCSDPDCQVVYFSNQEALSFYVDDLSVKVFTKDDSEDVNVCYCFDWTRKRIADQIKTTGISTAFDEVTEEVNAGNCECERKNPKGGCCLGDISRFTAEVINPITQ